MEISVVAHRRALHRIPELDDHLPETVAYVRSVLKPLGCEITSPISGSVCAWFDGGHSETAALRADMDALPVTEKTGLPYASVHPGVMHACGHDGHTALALAAAEYAAKHIRDLPRNVLVLFQPSEETTGGAKKLGDTGLLERYNVRRVFGLHLWPNLPEGQVFCRPGPMMARSGEVTVAVTGKSVHISRYQEGRDALAAGAEFLRRAYELAESWPRREPLLLRFGRMTSGAVRNAVSGETRLEGTVRTYGEDVFDACRQALTDMARALAAETGCGVDVHFGEGYPAVWNDEDLYAAVCAGLEEAAPLPLAEPVLAADDFSFYQRRVPGLYFFLGAGPTAELHAPDFSFDDECVLPRGAVFLQKLLTMK